MTRCPLPKLSCVSVREVAPGLAQHRSPVGNRGVARRLPPTNPLERVECTTASPVVRVTGDGVTLQLYCAFEVRVSF